jgi:hypothetical protein
MDFCHFHETNEEALPAFESNDINAESEDDDGNDEDQDLDPDPDGTTRNFSFELRKPPSVDNARCALRDLQLLLKPLCHDKTGYEDPKLPPILKERLMLMKNFLWLYTDMHRSKRTQPANLLGGCWGKAADQTAQNAGKVKGDHLSRCL